MGGGGKGGWGWIGRISGIGSYFGVRLDFWVYFGFGFFFCRFGVVKF